MNNRRVIQVFFQLKYQEIKDSIFGPFGWFALINGPLLAILLMSDNYHWAKVASIIIAIIFFSLFVIGLIVAFCFWINDNIRKAKKIVIQEEKDQRMMEIMKAQEGEKK